MNTSKTGTLTFDGPGHPLCVIGPIKLAHDMAYVTDHPRLNQHIEELSHFRRGYFSENYSNSSGSIIKWHIAKMTKMSLHCSQANMKKIQNSVLKTQWQIAN